jgi:voltage-gated potassium channel
VTATSALQGGRGQPRSDGDAAFLARFDARMRLPIVVSAVLPLIVVPQTGNWVGEVVGVVTWLVFLLDYVVQSRRRVRYARTRLGQFDLFVVVATAPWFLIPGAGVGSFVVLLRLARLARVLMVSRGARRLLDRVGQVAVVAAGVMVVASLVAYYAEHPTNPGFATVGDALWWGIVTLTTVGYGDIVPKTPAGRWAAVAIMITGIAVLGVLAGSLSSFFRLDSGSNGGAAGNGTAGGNGVAAGGGPAGPAATVSDAALQALASEVVALRYQVEALAERLSWVSPGPHPAEPTAGDDAPP